MNLYQGWHIGGILPITDMPILIRHNRCITDIAYQPIYIGSNAYRYRYIGFADMGYIGWYRYANPDLYGKLYKILAVSSNGNEVLNQKFMLECYDPS